MTKLILTAALAAILVSPLAITANAQSSGAAPSGSSGSGAAACNAITDPVKKEQCLKSSSGAAVSCSRTTAVRAAPAAQAGRAGRVISPAR